MRFILGSSVIELVIALVMISLLLVSGISIQRAQYRQLFANYWRLKAIVLSGDVAESILDRQNWHQWELVVRQQLPQGHLSVACMSSRCAIDVRWHYHSDQRYKVAW